MASNNSLQLEYYLESEYRWCKLEIISFLCGGIEKAAAVKTLDDLPKKFKGRYLYSSETNLWIYINVDSDDVRIKPGSMQSNYAW
uniref:Uncharacterized protein n=1 Tax=viral metagenome TaxID=1070528 RepID=A0A6C0CPT9_9ZZZZ